jgi:hypothetical protein
MPVDRTVSIPNTATAPRRTRFSVPRGLIVGTLAATALAWVPYAIIPGSSLLSARVQTGIYLGLLVNGVVLATVLASDLGPARKIGPARLLRPVIAAAVIIPLFVDRPSGNGSSLAVELAGVAAGLLGGLGAALMGVYRAAGSGKPVSRAGWPYAIFWTAVIGARAAFSYGAAHWFTTQIVSWAIANQVTEASIVDGLIFMAIAMILARTAVLGVRASRLPTPVLAAGWGETGR